MIKLLMTDKKCPWYGEKKCLKGEKCIWLTKDKDCSLLLMGIDEEAIQMAYNNTQKRRIEEGLIKSRRDYNDGNEV